MYTSSWITIWIPKVRWAVHPFFNKTTFTGWWCTYPSEKYEFVNWDDYSEWKIKHLPNHQHSESIPVTLIPCLNLFFSSHPHNTKPCSVEPLLRVHNSRVLKSRLPASFFLLNSAIPPVFTCEFRSPFIVRYTATKFLWRSVG